jgi:outer membrane receptor protein involved in Fe transport
LGEHHLKAADMKFNWYGSFNILDSYIPQQRRVQYNQSRETANAPFLLLMGESRSQKSGSIFYSTLSDYNYTAGGDLLKSFQLFNRKQTLKTGYVLQIKDRLFNSRPFSIYLPDGTSAVKWLDEDHAFIPENFDASDPAKFRFDEISGKQYRYMANSILNAGFFQFDNSVSEMIRVVWGVRYEHFDQLTGSTNKSDERFAHSKVGDLLPALNLTLKLNKQTNLRFSASKTLVRPEFRELSNFTFYDFELGAGVMGLSSLQRTKISNLDLRYELYPATGEMFTAGIFYKHFNQPIELYFNQSGVASNTFNYLNIDEATSFGAELEFRKRLNFLDLLKNFTIQSNISYIYNRVKSKGDRLPVDRPMQGQSPYIVNASLFYDIEKAGLSATLLFNQIGRRILYVGNDVTPEIWEAPRPLLDFQLSKKVLMSKAEIRLNISDIFNNTAYFYHDLDKNRFFKSSSPDALAITRNYGTTFSLTFGYAIK